VEAIAAGGGGGHGRMVAANRGQDAGLRIRQYRARLDSRGFAPRRSVA
jgi:hypothetical protein